MTTNNGVNVSIQEMITFFFFDHLKYCVSRCLTGIYFAYDCAVQTLWWLL